MKKNLLSLVLLAVMGLSALFSTVNAQTIIVQKSDGTNARLFSSLDSAVVQANANDYIYLSGGNYTITSNWRGYTGSGTQQQNFLVITKPLHFVGAGYAAGSDAPVINGTIAFRKSASGSSVTGISFAQAVYLDSISNMNISRCQLGSSSLWFCGIGTNNLITECMIKGMQGSTFINGNTGAIYSNTIVSKCIIRNNDIYYLSNMTFTNNVIFTLSYCNFLTVTNNIIRGSIFSNTNTTFKNNLIMGAITPVEGNTYLNNLSYDQYDDLFVNEAQGDYHLKATCMGKNMGTDGTDIGLYGTSQPFKENRAPSIPYFSNKNIAPETDADGKLKVNITIEAQER